MNARVKVDGQRGGSHIALLWFLSWCLSTSPCWGQDVARKPFSQDERARLIAGKLVVRPTKELRSGLRLIGGASWQIIKAPPDAVFRALLDTKYYNRSLPTVSAASLVSEQPTLRRVRLEHKKGPVGVAYRLALTIDRQRRDITFKLNDRLDSGMRAAWGFMSAHPYGQNQTLLSYGVMADPGDGLLVGMVRGVIHDWILKVPAHVKRHVESALGRKLYPVAAAAPAAVKPVAPGIPTDRR